MTSLAKLMGIASGGKILSPILTLPIFASRTWTAPQDGYVFLVAIGAGGGGAGSSSQTATGGYSGGLGLKLLKVVKNQVFTITLGAGGAGGPSYTGSNGSAGGATTVVTDGITYTVPGGLAGLFQASGVPTLPAGLAPSANWDLAANSSRPGAFATGKTGGAGLDIMMQGSDATASASVGNSGGGGVYGPGTGMNGGGSTPGGLDILGQGLVYPGTSVISSEYFWGISFYGGGGAAGSAGSSKGGNGGGGSGYGPGDGGNGGNGGGGGASYTATGGLGGYGGGGGGGSTGGYGGNGFACIQFFADMGV